MEKKMVSNTAQTTSIRERKHNKMGRKRKNNLANTGSTKSQEQLFGTTPAKDAKENK
jgi:hypothetical protein